MGMRHIIMVETNNAKTFCDNRCNNRKCSKHKSNIPEYRGVCKIIKLRNTVECEGYISKCKQPHKGIEEIKRKMEETGNE